MTDEQRREKFEETKVIPVSRSVFLEEWRSDPTAIIEKAKENDLSLGGYANVRAPASEKSPGGTMEWLLYNEGIRMVDFLGTPSSKMIYLPKIYTEKGESLDPLGQAMVAYWDQCYLRSLMTGFRTATLSGLTSQGGWRPLYDEAPIRSPQISAGFNFTRIVGLTRGIREDEYRVRRWANASTEQKMQKIVEGTEPEVFELTRKTKKVQLDNYRAGIEWTDEFINDPQTRAADITNAIEEIAIGHRLELLGDLGKLIVDTRTENGASYQYDVSNSTFGGYTHTANRLEYPYWTAFKDSFGDAYTPNVTIGNANAITSLKLMSITDGNNLSYGSFAMIEGSGLVDLNEDGVGMMFGRITNSGTGLTNTALYSFPSATTLAFIMNLGMTQDEIERVPGPRKTRRWLGAKSAFAILDPLGIREIEFA